MHNNLIFDLGFHNGTDTANYLSKGFDVIAIEANPSLIAYGKQKFEKLYTDQMLLLLNKAIMSSESPDDQTTFYINDYKTDWSSCNRSIAEQDDSTSRKVTVETISLPKLISTYGVPYYMKVDVEGNDIAVAKDLYLLEKKPLSVSFELNKKDYADIFSYLFLAGYKRFQLVNQANNVPYSSGDFTRFLPQERWVSFDEALSNYIKYRELKFIDNKNLALGWIDLHAAF